MAQDIKVTVRDNVIALLAHKFGEPAPGKSGVSRLLKLGIANGNAQRVLKGETDFQIGLLQQLAEKFDVEAWALLVPGLDPLAKPLLVSPTQRPGWPFSFEPQRFDALLPNEQGMVEHAARVEVERIESTRRRPPAPPTPSPNHRAA